jgi:hypothetical protein
VTEEPTPGPPPAIPDDPLAGLFRAAAGSPGVLICTHRNPDPDSISSALALRYLLEHAAGIRATVAYEGMIGRAEIDAFCLRCHPRHPDEASYADFMGRWAGERRPNGRMILPDSVCTDCHGDHAIIAAEQQVF